ncbi:hypothetical protein PCK2_000261 [Pneumocystis canis]|nr:hypothetical protein PCK2_000261 [Pneumocystis canis]
MLKFGLENKLIQQQDIFIPTEIPLADLYETKISETESGNWDILITNNHTQGEQDSLNFLLERLEKENRRLIDDPKRVSSRFLTNHSQHHIRELINSRINNPITSSFLINEITSIDDISNIDFWIELISDYNTTAIRSPKFLTEKIREGIPHPLRGLVWQSISGAQDTNLEGLFETLRNEQSPYEKIIIRDLSRTFPGVEMFKEEGGDGQKKLQSVLRAFSLYDAEFSKECNNRVKTRSQNSLNKKVVKCGPELSLLDVDAIWNNMNKRETVKEISYCPINSPEEKIKISRTYEFAGKVETYPNSFIISFIFNGYREEKFVLKDSAEARMHFSSINFLQTGKPHLRKPTKRVSSLEVANKRPVKLNTLEKSRLDWAKFVDKEGIADELKNASKDGYMDKQLFLQVAEEKMIKNIREGMRK